MKQNYYICNLKLFCNNILDKVMKNIIILCILLLSQLCLHAANENPKRVEYQYYFPNNDKAGITTIIAYPQFNADGKRVLTTFCLKKETTQDTLRYQYEKYDKNNLLTEIRIDLVVNGEIKPAYKEEIEYNKSGKPIINKKWNAVNDTLRQYNEVNYYYYNDNRLDSCYFYSVDWQNQRKHLISAIENLEYFDTLVTKFHIWQWYGGDGVYARRQEGTKQYDDKHRIKSSNTSTIWYSTKPRREVYNSEYTYSDDNLVEISTTFQDDKGSYETSSESYYYSNNKRTKIIRYKTVGHETEITSYDDLVYHNDKLDTITTYMRYYDGSFHNSKLVTYRYNTDGQVIEEKNGALFPNYHVHSAYLRKTYSYYGKQLSGHSLSFYDGTSPIFTPQEIRYLYLNIIDLNANQYLNDALLRYNNQSLTSVEIKYSDSSSVGDDNNKVLFSPNPVKDFMNINTDVNIDGMIEIYDASGAMLLQVNPSYRIDLRQLSSGFYLVKINGKSYKIVKE